MEIIEEEIKMLERELEIYKKLPKEDVIFLINRGKARENSAVETLLENSLDFEIISEEQKESLMKVWDFLKKVADCIEEEKEETKESCEDYSDAEEILNKAINRFSEI